MNENQPEYTPELEFIIGQIDKTGGPKPYDAKQRARRLLNYFISQDADNTSNDTGSIEEESTS